MKTSVVQYPDRKDRFWLSNRPRFPFFHSKKLSRATGSLGCRWMRHVARQDWAELMVSPDLSLVTFWLDERIGGGGTGPCISVYARGCEVLRFDCFGGDLGHYHIASFALWKPRSRRLQFRERTVHEQIHRASFEISANLVFYLSMNPRRSVRQLRFDEVELRRACKSARLRLKYHLQNVPALAHLAANPAEPQSNVRSLRHSHG